MWIKSLAQGNNTNAVSADRTRYLSISSPTLYHCTTALHVEYLVIILVYFISVFPPKKHVNRVPWRGASNAHNICFYTSVFYEEIKKTVTELSSNTPHKQLL